MVLAGSGLVSAPARSKCSCQKQTLTGVKLAFLYAVEILPLQYRSQVQSATNMVFWFVAFIAVYFGGQAAAEPNTGALIYIWFCIGGGIVTILSWIFVVESKCNTVPIDHAKACLTRFFQCFLADPNLCSQRFDA